MNDNQPKTARIACDRIRAAERYEETKLLAELAWRALLAAPRHPVDGTFYNIAGQAWIAAEAMYAESERRRPQE